MLLHQPQHRHLQLSGHPLRRWQRPAQRPQQPVQRLEPHAPQQCALQHLGQQGLRLCDRLALRSLERRLWPPGRSPLPLPPLQQRQRGRLACLLPLAPQAQQPRHALQQQAHAQQPCPLLLLELLGPGRRSPVSHRRGRLAPALLAPGPLGSHLVWLPVLQLQGSHPRQQLPGRQQVHLRQRQRQECLGRAMCQQEQQHPEFPQQAACQEAQPQPHRRSGFRLRVAYPEAAVARRLHSRHQSLVLQPVLQQRRRQRLPNR